MLLPFVVIISGSIGCLGYKTVWKSQTRTKEAEMFIFTTAAPEGKVTMTVILETLIN